MSCKHEYAHHTGRCLRGCGAMRWPDASGFYISGGQFYYASAVSPREGVTNYEVRDCRNFECVVYLDERTFYKDREQRFPWFAVTLQVPREALQ